jgi:hypothetical protein
MVARIQRIMCDPVLLFDKLTDLMDSPRDLYDIARNKGPGLTDRIAVIVSKVVEPLAYTARGLLDLNLSGVVDAGLSSPETLSKVIGTLTSREDDLSHEQISHILQQAPALSVFIVTFREYVKTILRSNLARIRAGSLDLNFGRPSDYGDFMHLIYAPYVDYIRLDTKFGALAEKNHSIRTRIVRKRRDLANIITSQSEPGVMAMSSN